MFGSWDPELGRLVCVIILGGFNIYFELKYRTFYMKDERSLRLLMSQRCIHILLASAQLRCDQSIKGLLALA